MNTVINNELGDDFESEFEMLDRLARELDREYMDLYKELGYVKSDFESVRCDVGSTTNRKYDKKGRILRLKRDC